MSLKISSFSSLEQGLKSDKSTYVSTCVKSAKEIFFSIFIALNLQVGTTL